MPRAYTVATAALTLGTSAKWIDNILSQHVIGGVQKKRQGISRRLSIDGILVLAIVDQLIRELGLPRPHAIQLAESLLRNGGRYETARGLSIALDLNAAHKHLVERLESAVEAAPVPRRGRPPTNKTGRLD
jgi:hypothetical protein